MEGTRDAEPGPYKAKNTHEMSRRDEGDGEKTRKKHWGDSIMSNYVTFPHSGLIPVKSFKLGSLRRA